jgi:hypothetical protein
MKRIIDHDPLTGVTTYHSYDHSTGTTHIEEVQDVEKIVEWSKRMAKDESYRKEGMKGDNWMHVARVPITIVQKLITEYKLDPYSTDEGEINKVLQAIQRDFPHLMPSGKAFS